MNFLVFCPFAFIISKKNCLHLVELIKNEAALKVRYMHGREMCATHTVHASISN
jgi:hypothetical protein